MSGGHASRRPFAAGLGGFTLVELLVALTLLGLISVLLFGGLPSWTGPGGGASLLNSEPGQESGGRFKMIIPGIFMYHCATASPSIPEHVANGMYGTIRMHQEREFPGREHGTRLANPDFAPFLQRMKDAKPDAMFVFVPAGQGGMAAILGLDDEQVRVVCTQAAHGGSKGQPFGRIDDNTVCPCCGSKPTASPASR